jgi:hypothetical protein
VQHLLPLDHRRDSRNCINFATCWVVKLMQFGWRAVETGCLAR